LADPTIQTRVLQKAVRLLGSEKALADYLRVPAASLASWLQGPAQPPTAIFLLAVDLLLDTNSMRGVAAVPDATPEMRRGARKR
jgi:hypothetical protein